MGLSPAPREHDGDPPGLAARRAALALVHGVIEEARAVDEAAERAAGFETLAPRDRAFARTLAATALRRRGEIDALLAECLETSLPRSAARVHNGLRLGVAQIVFLDIPAHAAVDGAVTLAADSPGRWRPLVNAVLRRIAHDGKARAAELDSARLNTPDWLWRALEAEYGAATCRRIAEAHLADPPLDLTVKHDAAGWAVRLGGAMLPTGAVRLARPGQISALPGFAEGAWWVQDAAAALPARILLGALPDPAGARIADLCAAPGGKTAQLAAAGARVTAVDRSASRLARLARNLARLRLSASIVAAAVERWRPAERFDAVLLDAPCSATGTIRRHPDVVHAKSHADPARLAPAQDRLLAAAARVVAPGGTLVYSVCSLLAEEGPERIRAFLLERPDFRIAPVRGEEIGGLAECLADDGTVRTLPCHLAEAGGIDGFYIARLVRRA